MNNLYSLETRKNVLEMYREGVPIDDIIYQNGVSRGRVYEWIREAKLPHRRKSIACPAQFQSAPESNPSSMTLTERKALVEQFRISKNKKAFALEHHIPRSTLYGWSKNDDLIQDYKGNTINMKMYYEALRSKEKLQKIIEVLHKVNCTVFSPLPIKMAIMESLIGQYSANILCEALCVNRTTFHHYLEDNKRENTWFNFRRTLLKKAITDIFDEHDQIPGVKKMRALLQDKGYNVSEKIVRELMTELGIASIRNSAKEIYQTKAVQYADINLKNMFPGDQPDQIWISDFTYFHYQGKSFYVCIIMDQCSRKVLAHKVGQKSTTQMLTYCFNNAMALRKPIMPLIFHSDQGCQYTSTAFRNLLKANGVIQSFSRRGTPTDNAVIECFNSSFKREELYRRDYQSVQEFKRRISDYIKYYNESRPHESLGYVTPTVFEQRFLMTKCPDTSSNPDEKMFRHSDQVL